MVPQDQQVEVASPGTISDELDLGIGFAINKFTTNARPAPAVRTVRGRGAVVQALGYNLLGLADRCGRPHQAEKELPQPQDFDEFGFTNTKPCCIRVSW